MYPPSPPGVIIVSQLKAVFHCQFLCNRSYGDILSDSAELCSAETNSNLLLLVMSRFLAHIYACSTQYLNSCYVYVV
uniref:Uncharacterized protein n=1 Tax=Anguilla anguilla TaxID=7936 RepID=A0A0E9WU83_ANGAN